MMENLFIYLVLTQSNFCSIQKERFIEEDYLQKKRKNKIGFI